VNKKGFPAISKKGLQKQFKLKSLVEVPDVEMQSASSLNDSLLQAKLQCFQNEMPDEITFLILTLTGIRNYQVKQVQSEMDDLLKKATELDQF